MKSCLISFDLCIIGLTKSDKPFMTCETHSYKRKPPEKFKKNLKKPPPQTLDDIDDRKPEERKMYRVQIGKSWYKSHNPIVLLNIDVCYETCFIVHAVE
jgi:hypothetical protein